MKEIWYSISVEHREIIKCLIFSLLVVACVAMCSCSSVQYVPVESVRVDSIYINNTKKDSVYVQDSIFVHERGDTVFVNKYKKLYIERLSHDTIHVTKVDSILKPYPVEKELNFYQRNCMKLGEVTLGILIFAFLSFAAWLAYKVFK